MTRRRRPGWGRRLAIGASLVLCGVFLFPVAWMVLTSFKPTTEIFTTPPRLRFTPTLEHYQAYATQARIVQRYLNTVIIAFGAALLSTAVGTFCGYALAKLRVRGKTLLGALVVASRAIPSVALVVPLYIVFRNLDMLDRHLTLVLAYASFLVPYAVWLTRSFFLDVPSSLEEAALLDGCSRLGAFLRIVIPCTLPGVTATLVFCVILGWNELLYALILTNRDAVTIPVSLAGMAADTELGALWGPLAAIGTLTIVPVVVFALFVQTWLVRGLTLGSVKG
jgi:multiple sugar transport system permease protein